MTTLLGVVLAGGAGSRMGGPKALLRIDGAPLAVHHARRLLEAGCLRVLVVVPPEACEALSKAFVSLAEPERIELVPAITTSPAESLEAAFLFLERLSTAELGAEHTLLVVTPVDLLPAETATIRSLVTAIQESRGALDAATPKLGERGGHPVVARLRVLRTSPAHGPTPLRDRLAALGSRRVRIAVNDPNVIGDFDVPGDLPNPP